MDKPMDRRKEENKRNQEKISLPIHNHKVRGFITF